MDRTRQYYYKVNSCPASSPYDVGCVCWHDEGTGPLVTADKDFTTTLFSRSSVVWRDKPKPHPELLALAEKCGATLTGKPDGSESITVVFTIPAWREFDRAISAKELLDYFVPATEARLASEAHAVAIENQRNNARNLLQELTDLRSAVLRVNAERDALRADAERLRIRGEAYEAAYGIAYQATYQSHNGHWDKTMQGGSGCPECIRAREARENCDAALRDGLEKLVERAARTGSKT